ncbi:unnamed protein product [Rotaria sp. Silwood1]|nr:unnamed protein product [Rotaria sp. Silwood1]
MFNDLCQNVLKLIGNRIVSLRITLTNVIDGWSLVSSSLKYYQTTLLQRLHLIDITPHEFDNILCNPLIKRLRTLLVDVTPCNPFHYLEIEGVYLTKVCSQIPCLTNCRLPFNVYHKNLYKLNKYSVVPIMSLPNLLNTTHLRTLTIGMNTSYFLERLLRCIPFIEYLSVGVNDLAMNEHDNFDINSLPTTVDAHLLLHLSRLHINCKNSISFHRTIALLLFVFGQLNHLSLKLQARVVISSPLVISGDIIQQLCINRLKPRATYNINLKLDVQDDIKEKIIFNSFLKVPFANRQEQRVFIQEHIPWSLLTKISIDEGDVVTTGELESILRMAYNVHTLVIRDDRGVFSHAILHNIDNLGTRVNQQIQTLEIDDMTLTLKNIQYFGRLLSNQLANLKKVLFKIYDSCDGWKWIPSRIVDGENESTKRIVNVIYFLIDHLQQLVLLHIDFISFNYLESPCFPHLIQHQLNQYPINRPYRLRCLAERIEICL